MTPNEAYRFLGQVRGHENKIKRLKRTIEGLRSGLTPGAIRYDKDRVQATPQNVMEELFAKIDEYERKLQEEYRLLAESLLKVEKAISRMPDTREKNVLIDFYLGRISIGDIADGMGITVRHCFRLRKNGIAIFCEVNK